MSAYPATYDKDGRADTMKMYATKKEIKKVTPKYETLEPYKYEEVPQYQYADLSGASSSSKNKSSKK
jgi:hypothetical protein